MIEYEEKNKENDEHNEFDLSLLNNSDKLNQQENIENKKKLEYEIFDCIEFTKGNHKLKINLSHHVNRVWKLNILIDDEIEIRPSTYAGSKMAKTFWEMLKGSLK